ncbi:MAG: ectonucleotide pyrophosphatase/phosphodiesterase [Opitutaceae bacterium]
MTRFVFLFLALLASHVTAGRGAAVESPLILISLDGFRWDYLEKYAAEAPTLRALRQGGVAARGLIPVFPSNTFPNHYSIVTGLRPAHHGIMNNVFFDPKVGRYFRYNLPAAVQDSHWWRGEPIWATAIKQGRQAAASFWVGSEAEIGGVRPTFWKKYDYRIPFESRRDELIGWLQLPAAERPSVIVFYLEETNSAGHTYGPDSPEVGAAIRLTDGRIATMLARLRAENVEPNLVVVSDHGMTATSLDRVVVLEDYIARDAVQIDDEGSALSLRPLRGTAEDIVRAFARVPHVKAYLRADLPARFHFLRGGDRIAPIWVLPDEGWHAGSRASVERLRTRYAAQGYLQGDHGYDPQLPNMHGILIAHGPAFRPGVEIPPVENIHIYNLMCAVLRLMPAKNDGDDRLVRAALKK